MNGSKPSRLPAVEFARASVFSAARRQFLHALAAEVPEDFFSPEEAVILLVGRMDTARRCAGKVRLRMLVEKAGITALPYHPSAQGLPAPPPPVPLLSRLNRSKVFPPLLRPDAMLPTVQLSQILEVVRSARETGAPWPRLLDVLVTSSGVNWRSAARLLELHCDLRIEDNHIPIVAQARHFWQRYAEGRARVQALQTTRRIPLWRGDWAHFAREEFAILLPGAILPDHFERSEFLTNYVHQSDEQTVDVYNLIGRPLFRHPFPPRFQPPLLLK